TRYSRRPDFREGLSMASFRAAWLVAAGGLFASVVAAVVAAPVPPARPVGKWEDAEVEYSFLPGPVAGQGKGGGPGGPARPPQTTDPLVHGGRRDGGRERGGHGREVESPAGQEECVGVLGEAQGVQPPRRGRLGADLAPAQNRPQRGRRLDLQAAG